MANDLNRSIKIYLDNSAAMNSADELQKRMGQLEATILGLQTAGKGNSEQAKKAASELVAQGKKYETYKQQVAATEKVLKNLSGATYNELLRAKKDVDIQLKTSTRNTELYNKRLNIQKAISRELIVVQKDMRTEVGCQATSWGRAASFVNQYMGLIGSAVASITGITMAFSKFRDERDKLEASSANLKALTGLGDEDIKRLEDTAKRLSTTITKEGVRIKQSAVEIDDSFAIIGSQRPELLKNAEALEKVTQDAIYLSIASKDKLEPAAKALTTVMNQMNLGASESRRIINAIAAGSQAGAGNIQYITDAFEKSGTTANLMNIQLEQHIGLIEAVAPKYSEATVAGNSLDKVLLKMKEKNIGYKDGVFDLSRAIDEITSRFKKGESATSLFGAEHAKMAEILVMNKADIIKYTEAVTGTNKAVEQANINSDINEVKRAQARNRMNLMAIDLIEKLNPAITKAMDITVTWAEKLIAVANWIGKNSTLIIILVAEIALYTAAIKLNAYWEKISNEEKGKSLLLEKTKLIYTKASTAAIHLHWAAMSLLNGHIKDATRSMRAFLVTLGINPITAVIVAVTALTIGLYKLLTHASDAEKAMANMQKRIRGVEMEASQSIAKQKTELEQFLRLARDESESKERRLAAIKKINEISPEYLGNLTLEEINTTNATIAINRYIDSIYAMAKAQAAKEQLVEIERERIRLDVDPEAFNEQLPWWEKLEIGFLRMIDKGKADEALSGMVARGRERIAKAKGMLDLQAEELRKIIAGNTNTTLLSNEPKEGDKKNINGSVYIYKNGEWVEKISVDPKEKTTELKSSMGLVLNQLDIRHTEELARLKKFKLETNQTEASYNADLRREELAHYAARIQILDAFKKKTSDKLFLADIDKMLSENQNKMLEVQLKYRDAVNKILLDANPLDKEKAAYEERLREVGLFGANIEDLTEAQKKALELLEKQHQDNVLKIKRDADKEKEQQAEESFKKEFKTRKTELETEYENESSSIKMMSGFDFIPEEKIFELQKDLAQKKIDMLKEETEARRKAGLDTIEIQALTMAAEKDMTTLLVQQYQTRWSKYKTFAVDMGTMLGEVIAGSETALADMGIYLINMGLDMLKKQLQIAAALAMGWSLASTESILTFGIAGIAKGLAIQALIEGVFAAAKAAIGGSLKSKKPSSTNSTPEVSGSQTGSYVTKGNSGFYDGGHTGLGGVMEVAGPVHKNEYVVPAWEMQEPMAMNHVVALEAIRRQRTNTNSLPVTGFANGGYSGRVDDETMPVQNNLELVKVIRQLASVLFALQAKGVKAYVVYSDIQKAGEVLDKSRNIGSKS